MPNTPKKYKGFSKLPEAVQQKMDSKAAMKYMEGGAVKKVLGMKYGGEARVRGMSRGGGAAVSGTKFTGCK